MHNSVQANKVAWWQHTLEVLRPARTVHWPKWRSTRLNVQLSTMYALGGLPQNEDSNSDHTPLIIVPRSEKIARHTDRLENCSLLPQSFLLSCDYFTNVSIDFTLPHTNTHTHTQTLAYFYMYTVNHKKRDILFLTITLANLNQFL